MHSTVRNECQICCSRGGEMLRFVSGGKASVFGHFRHALGGVLESGRKKEDVWFPISFGAKGPKPNIGTPHKSQLVTARDRRKTTHNYCTPQGNVLNTVDTRLFVRAAATVLFTSESVDEQTFFLVFVTTRISGFSSSSSSFSLGRSSLT